MHVPGCNKGTESSSPMLFVLPLISFHTANIDSEGSRLGNGAG
jgi:hypothetical protein